MTNTDMAVVVSQGQNEIADMKAKGLDTLAHRRRMVTEDLMQNPGRFNPTPRTTPSTPTVTTHRLQDRAHPSVGT